MFVENETLSTKQFERIFLIEIFATFSLTMPAILTRGVEYQAIWALLLGILLARCYLAFLLKIRGAIREDYVNSKGITSIYFVRFVIRSSYTLVLFVSLIQTNLLKKQSRFFLLLPFLLLCMYVVYKGMETRGRVLELLFWVIFIPLLFVLVLSMKEVSIKEVLPKGEWEWKPFLTTSYAVLLTYSCMEFLLFQKGMSKKSAYKSFDQASLLHLLLFITTIGLFGVQLSKDSMWPAFAIMQTAKLPADFLSRLDIFFLAFWIFSMFGVVSGYMLYVTQTESNSFSLLFFSICVIVLTLLSTDIERSSIFFFKYMMWIDFPIAVLMPLFVVGIRNRKRGGEK